MQEIWKDIPNYSGYQVSNLGNVRTFNKITFTKRHGIRHWEDRLLKQKVSTNKYGRKDFRVELWNNGKHKTYLVSRLVGLTFNEMSLDTKLTINHKDGNSLNNSLDNLEIITLKENIRHGYQTGLYSNQMKVRIIKNGISKVFPSLSKGNEYIGRTHDYLSAKIKKNIFSDDEYEWELI